jgi:hypothetical protein
MKSDYSILYASMWFPLCFFGNPVLPLPYPPPPQFLPSPPISQGTPTTRRPVIPRPPHNHSPTGIILALPKNFCRSPARPGPSHVFSTMNRIGGRMRPVAQSTITQKHESIKRTVIMVPFAKRHDVGRLHMEHIDNNGTDTYAISSSQANLPHVPFTSSAWCGLTPWLWVVRSLYRR